MDTHMHSLLLQKYCVCDRKKNSNIELIEFDIQFVC